MPATIATGSPAWGSATGGAMQGHIGFAPNQGVWWCYYLNSTNQLAAKYSSDFITWSTPTGSPFTLTASHNNVGRNFAFWTGDSSGIDVMHMASGYVSGGTTTSYHSRFTLGTTVSQTNAEAATGTSATSYGSNPSGVATALDVARWPYDATGFWSISGASGEQTAATGSNTDDGVSGWTAGFATPTQLYSPTDQVSSNWLSGTGLFVPIHGHQAMILVSDNGSGVGTFTDLQYATASTAGTWSTGGAVFGSSSTAADSKAWGSVKRTVSDIHAVRLSNGSNAYDHAIFNGTSWSAGNTIPTLAYGVDSGIVLATDGTYVYAHAIDSSSNIQQCIWSSGSGWTAWSIVVASGSPGRKYLTGCQAVQSGFVGLAWADAGATNFNIVGSLVAAGAPMAGGTASITLNPVVLSGTGGYEADGTAGLTLASLVLACSAAAGSGASSSITLNPLSLVGNGFSGVSSVGLVGLNPLSVVGLSISAMGGSAAITLNPAFTSATAGVAIGGTAGLTLNPVILVGSGFSGIGGTAYVTLNPVAISATAGLGVFGSAAITLNPLVVVGLSTTLYAGYFAYSDTGIGDPINYGSPIATIPGLNNTTYTTSPLFVPGIWKFGVRTYNEFGIEQNIDAQVTIILDASGNDITNLPNPPTNLKVFATAGGSIRVEWWFPLASGPKAPAGFHVYISPAPTLSYASPVGTVSYASGIQNTFRFNSSGYSDGVTYVVGVRAFNAVSEEKNTSVVSVVAESVGPTAVVGLTATAVV